MGEKDKADAEPVPGGVAARLVVPLDPAEAEPVPRRHGCVADFEEPEPQPTALEGGRGEVAVERREPDERRLAPRPAFAVQVEEDVEVAPEIGATLAEPVAETTLGEGTLAPAQLLPEVAAPGGEKLLPGVPLDSDDRVRVDTVSSCSEQASPAVVPAQLLPDEDIRTSVVEHPQQCGGGCRPILGRAERPELVGRAVADEADHPQARLRPDVEGEQRERAAAPRSARRHERTPSASQVPPPGRRPLPRPEDVVAALGQTAPVVAHGVEGRRLLDDKAGILLGHPRLRARVARRSSGERRTNRRPSRTSRRPVES